MLASATARSRWPLPKSPATIENGVDPTASDEVSENVPSPMPLQDINRAIGRVGHGQVEIAGAEVAGHDRRRSCSPRGARRVAAGAEISPALIGQDGDVAGVDVGDRQVDAAVVLEVALGDRDGALARPGSAAGPETCRCRYSGEW